MSGEQQQQKNDLLNYGRLHRPQQQPNKGEQEPEKEREEKMKNADSAHSNGAGSLSGGNRSSSSSSDKSPDLTLVPKCDKSPNKQTAHHWLLASPGGHVPSDSAFDDDDNDDEDDDDTWSVREAEVTDAEWAI
jgi:hypothetical protein